MHSRGSMLTTRHRLAAGVLLLWPALYCGAAQAPAPFADPQGAMERAEHLADITDLREGIQWVSWGGRDPLHEYLTSVHARFEELELRIGEEIPKRVEEAQMGGLDPAQRGATWTYLTSDQPFGSWSERIMRGVVRKIRSRNVWG